MKAFRLPSVLLPSMRVALGVVAVVTVLAVFGKQLAPFDPLAQHPADALQGPSFAHLFGTDYLGRDVLSRLVAGTGRSVAGALEAVAIGLVLGVLPGLASLWMGRTIEWLLLRAVDALMTLPFIIFAVAVTGIIGNGLNEAMLAIGVLFAPMFFRITRAAALSLTHAQYIEAAELFGASRWYVMRTHVVRKVAPTIAVTAAHATGGALLAVASLTFLGIGVQPPAPTWGGVLASELGFLAQQPWAPVIPAILIMVTVAALNALADGVRDAGAVTELQTAEKSAGTGASAAAGGSAAVGMEKRDDIRVA